jgi:hypothetical protein
MERVALGLIAVSILPVAVQAAFAPQSFVDDFPLGRSWVARSGDVYDEHLVRDVGALLLALMIATAWTVLRHAEHLDGYAGIDTVGLIGSLVMIPVLAPVALWVRRWSPGAVE